MKQQGIRIRSLTSLFTTISFLVVAVSGLVLSIMPSGRVAYWIDWRLIGLSKTHWGNLHLTFSLLLIVMGVFHISYNWKALTRYLYDKVGTGVKLKKELLVTVLLSLLLGYGSIQKVPPVSYVFDLSRSLKKSWSDGKTSRAPFGHAEMIPLKKLTKKLNLDLKASMHILKNNDIAVNSPNESLKKIAANNNTSPMELYQLIKKK